MSTTSSLVVDNFQTSDNGSYVCQARDGMMTVNSSTLSLTGIGLMENTLYVLYASLGTKPSQGLALRLALCLLNRDIIEVNYKCTRCDEHTGHGQR